MLVYKVTNKSNGKAYIGKTTYTLQDRKNNHLSSARNNSQHHFHRAIRKWGEDAFLWEVVEEALTEQELNEAEIRWIEKEDTFKNGYNQTLGGEGQRGWVPSEETRRLWSQQRKGKKINRKPRPKKQKPEPTMEEKEARRKAANKARSEKLKGRVPWNKGKKNWMEEVGYNIEEATRKKQDARRKNGYVWVIEAYDLDGNLIATFDSQSAAAKHFGFDHKTIRRKIDKTPHKGVFFKRANYL